MNEERFPEFIENLATTVEGDGDGGDVTIFTLSTCQWCKKCKRYLGDKGVGYRYIDIDRLSGKEKSKVLDFLARRYKTRIKFPFLICDRGIVVGYKPDEYEKILKGGK